MSDGSRRTNLLIDKWPLDGPQQTVLSSSRKYVCALRARAAVASALVLVITAVPTRAPELSGAGNSWALEATAGAAVAVSSGERLRAAVDRCAPRMDASERKAIAEVILRESARHGYDPMFVQALVEVESTCRPAVRSGAGAVGLIQVMPATARAVAERYGIAWQGASGLVDPSVNVALGLRYLADLEERFDDPYLAVAAYNLGPTRVARMAPERARGAVYVRKVLGRYEGLLREHPPVSL